MYVLYALLLYSQIERLRFGRAYVFIQSQHQYLFFRKTHEIQSLLYSFVRRRCFDCVHIQLLGIAIVSQSKCCVCVILSTKQKSHSVLFGSATMTMTMRWDFPWGIRLVDLFDFWLGIATKSG